MQVDNHFRTTPLEDNIPVLMALMGIWHRNICGVMRPRPFCPTTIAWRGFAAYLQQLDMESNGKRRRC